MQQIPQKSRAEVGSVDFSSRFIFFHIWIDSVPEWQMPSMPSRRSHKKSRKGCLECKRRHVKCDEGVPKCTLCRRRKLECSYPPSGSEGDSPQAPDGSEGGGPTSVEDRPLPTRMMETRLFHQYLTSTYHTLSQDGLSAYHLSMSIPRMASSCPYLLDSLLALSALHLASVEEENRASWLDTALNYQGQACSGLGKVVTDLSQPDFEPAFVASIFILLLALGFKAISLDNQPQNPVSVILEVRNLISGPAMIFNRIHAAGGSDQLAGLLCVTETQESLQGGKHSNDSAPPEDHQKLFRLHEDIVTSLDQLGSTIDAKEDLNKDTYRGTWQLLYQAIEPWPKIGPHGGIIAWPLFLSDEFCSLLQNDEWMARILFLHYGLAMHLLCNRWYVRDWGRRLVMATLEALDEIPQEWNDTIAWIKKAAQSAES